MIVLINGPLGIGTSTLAEALAAVWSMADDRRRASGFTRIESS